MTSKHEELAARRMATLRQGMAPAPPSAPPPAPPAAEPAKKKGRPPADTERLNVHVPRDLMAVLIERAAEGTRRAKRGNVTVQQVLLDLARRQAGLGGGEGTNG
jgi:hypothetical protein